MENIKYEITEEDIKKYLDIHSKDELIKFKEALFVKYMKHNEIFSKEKIEILISKSSNSIDALSISDACTINNSFYSFKNFINDSIIDTSAYMHIMIPVIKLNSEKLKDITLTNGHIEYFLPNDLEDYDCGKLVDTIENYQIAGKINKDKDLIIVDDIYLSKNECIKELSSYSNIYGKKAVEKVKKLVKEG